MFKSLIHFFLTVDNRHLLNYIFSYLFGKYPEIKFKIIPFYIFATIFISKLALSKYF